VKQEDAEGLLRKHGRTPLASAVEDLETRLQMPVEVVGEVRRPSSWLKENLERKAKRAKVTANLPSTKKISAEDMKKRKAAWTESWLRVRKDDLQSGFEELSALEQTALLEKFKVELASRNIPQYVKRLEISGWKHPMIKDSFIKFIGIELLGPDWFKPSEDDILSIAALMG
jgi:hypothetical protein